MKDIGHERVTLVKAAATQGKAISALGARFIIMRYGRGNLGFFWMFVEPMILCTGVMILWRMTKGNFEHGLPIVTIVFTGYMPLTLWRHLSNSGVFLLRSSMPVFVHRNITQLDVVITRLFLEAVSVTAATCLVFFVLYALNIVMLPMEYHTIFIGWGIMAVLGAGFSMMLAAATEFSEVTERFIQPTQYLMVPLSGCFFLVDWLPYSARDIVLYNPFVHSYELIRAGFFGNEVVTYGDAKYGVICGIMSLGVGFLSISLVRDRIGS